MSRYLSSEVSCRGNSPGSRPVIDVAASPLNEVRSEFLAEAALRFAGEVGQVCELRVDQPEEILKSGLISRMRGRGQQDQMTFAIVRQRADQFVAALPSPAAAHGGMRLVDNDHLRAGALEVEEAPLALDEVELTTV